MRVHVLRTRRAGEENWTNRAVLSDERGLGEAQKLGFVLQSTVGAGYLEVAVDTFDVDGLGLPIVNELARDGRWRVENRSGDLVDPPPPRSDAVGLAATLPSHAEVNG